ncbi:PEP-CTERM sorting domain-containing protein [Nostoc sp. CHAB 5784]|uniref:PEP-CTERM sorting domain-containing protein n=1 Tax=Nostoc mirabile TaxID=2907820 RepID=UPI001E624C9F|nr:PEP-CTERM sorting domain-containing protein [Nostoc mirabile]MCC5670454.1 PEP-CTERM sorting domain-containing protein [Nostoc mirabile CHAB5784]
MVTATVIKKISMAVVSSAIIALGTGGLAQAAIIVPNELKATEGDINNGFPFSLDFQGRYQQVFSASAFASLSEPQLISQIAFRPDADFGNAFSSTLSSILINLSTTTSVPDNLSNTFANNVGADNITVFSGPLSLSSADEGLASGPKNFDIVINLQNPFLYDPTKGNLLLDVRNFVRGTTTQFDAQQHLSIIYGDSDSVSRQRSFDPNSATAEEQDTIGLVTKFTFTSVPESSTTLGTLAISVWGAALLKRKHQKKTT